MYHVLKCIHVLAVILFLGNIITGLFWKLHADGTRDLRIMAHTLRGITRSDRWFTIPSIVVITLTGFAAAVQAGLPLLRTGWIFWSIVAFTLSGVAFVWQIAPLQRRLEEMAQQAVSDESTFDWALYKSESLKWELWGLFADLMPLIAVGLMVLKPSI